jgi:AAA domain
MLVVLSGLPGVGKTTIARKLAVAIGAVHMRIDTIEQALRRSGVNVEGEGYAVAYAVTEDNLRLGRTVVVDCVNPWPLTRREWEAVADRAGVRTVNVELVCSDVDTPHRIAPCRYRGPPIADMVGGGPSGLPSLGWRAADRRHHANGCGAEPAGHPFGRDRLTPSVFDRR